MDNKSVHLCRPIYGWSSLHHSLQTFGWFHNCAFASNKVVGADCSFNKKLKVARAYDFKRRLSNWTFFVAFRMTLSKLDIRIMGLNSWYPGVMHCLSWAHFYPTLAEWDLPACSLLNKSCSVCTFQVSEIRSNPVLQIASITISGPYSGSFWMQYNLKPRECSDCVDMSSSLRWSSTTSGQTMNC